MLEQLLGSRSVGSAMMTQIQLRALNALGISLLVPWAFSPLGSQPVLRALSSRHEPKIATLTIVIYDNLHASGLSGLVVQSPASLENTDAFSQYLHVLFSAVLMTPQSIKIGSMAPGGGSRRQIPTTPLIHLIVGASLYTTSSMTTGMTGNIEKAEDSSATLVRHPS